MKVTNYIITHKAFTPPKLPDYTPLQVGNGPDLGWLRDNTGDEISAKNPNWCELTGLYWIWKNDHESDVVSISHYRRYFQGREGILRSAEIEQLLGDHDILLAEFEPYKETVYQQYANESGFAKDLDNVRGIIEKQDPDALAAFDSVMNQGGLCQYNMMVCRKDRYDAYCRWLFQILEELEPSVDLADYNDYQKRIYGFLAERLLNVWVRARDLRVKTLPVLQTEMTAAQKRRLQLRRLRNRAEFGLKKLTGGNAT